MIGIIQGLSEFLPISSSGHIELAEYFLDFEDFSEDSLAFSVLLHLATAMSTIVVFRKDILELIIGFFKRDKNTRKYVCYIIISMIPAGLIGYGMEDFFQEIYSGKIILVCVYVI